MPLPPAFAVAASITQAQVVEVDAPQPETKNTPSQVESDRFLSCCTVADYHRSKLFNILNPTTVATVVLDSVAFAALTCVDKTTVDDSNSPAKAREVERILEKIQWGGALGTGSWEQEPYVVKNWTGTFLLVSV